MQLLEAINEVLSSAGQEPVQDLSSTSMEKGKAQAAVDRARKKILSNGYAFNTDVVDLQPDSAEGNKVPFPTGFLFVGVGSRPFVLDRSSTEDRRLSFRYTVNAVGNQQAFIWNLRDPAFVTSEVKDVIQIFDVLDTSEDNRGHDRIPELCASWIAQEAAARYFHTVNGGPSSELGRLVERAKTKFINRERFKDIHSVSGFRTLQAIGAGGSTSSFDVRTQAHLL